jgi:hypothetical protein
MTSKEKFDKEFKVKPYTAEEVEKLRSDVEAAYGKDFVKSAFKIWKKLQKAKNAQGE